MAPPASPIAAGTRFGRWTVVLDDGPRAVACRCDCGTERDVCRSTLKAGVTNSCGCLKVERQRARIKHGHKRVDSPTPEYTVWRGMVGRCYDPKNISFKHYGVRGIKVCDRWRSDFAAFLADMGRRPPGGERRAAYSIERENNDGDYEPGNCSWATQRDQVRNRRPRPPSEEARPS